MENDNIDLELVEKPACEVELNVLVKPEACQKAYKQAVKKIRGRISMPGFRKGKAPEAMVIANYGDAIEEEWRDEVLNLGLREALSLSGKYPWSQEALPSPQVDSMSKEEGCRVVYKFESEPDVPTITGEDLHLVKEKMAEISDEKVEEELLNLRKQYATYETVDEAAVEGGFARFDVDQLGDEEVKMVKDHRAEIHREKLAGWLIDLLIGAKAGDVVEGETTPREGEEEGFEPKKVRVTVHAVEKEVLPEDEAFIKQVRVESVDDLKVKMRERLEHQEKERIEGDLRRKLWEEICKNNHFELPASLLKEETRALVKQQVAQLQQEGASHEDILAREKEIEAGAAGQAQRKLMELFVARKVASEAGLQPTDKDIQDRAVEIMTWEAFSRGQMPSPKDRSPQEMARYRNTAYISLVRERAESALLEKATVDEQ